jgi:hypothetical protein
MVVILYRLAPVGEQVTACIGGQQHTQLSVAPLCIREK